MNKLFLGIDIGGSSIKYGWGSPKLGLKESKRIILDDNSMSSLQKTVNLLLEDVNKNLGMSCIAGIGIGVPGAIDCETQKIVGVNPNLPEFTNINPIDLLPNELREITFADNDANLMALGEANLIEDCSHLLGITIGSGIGSGFVINGKVYHGANGFAMELGHTIVNQNGLHCNCGKQGCLEAYASVNGMKNQVRKKFPQLKINDLSDILTSAADIALIKQIMNNGIEYLAVSIANLAMCLDADAIIIGGGAVEVIGYPMKRLQKKILDTYPNNGKKRKVIDKAKLGNYSGVFGAICLADGKINCV